MPFRPVRRLLLQTLAMPTATKAWPSPHTNSVCYGPSSRPRARVPLLVGAGLRCRAFLPGAGGQPPVPSSSDWESRRRGLRARCEKARPPPASILSCATSACARPSRSLFRPRRRTRSPRLHTVTGLIESASRSTQRGCVFSHAVAARGPSSSSPSSVSQGGRGTEQQSRLSRKLGRLCCADRS